MSRPPLDLTPIGTNTTNRTMSPIESIPVRTKTPDPTPLTRPTKFPDQNGKENVPGEPDTDPSSSESSSKDLILRRIAITVNQLKRKVTRKKSVINTGNRTRQTHCREILIRLTTVTTDANDVKEEPSENGSDLTIRTVNGKVADNSV